MTDLTLHLENKLREALGELPDDVARALVLQPPRDRSHGDTALACFPLAKHRGAPPPQVATELAAAIEADEQIESATAVGPFVNFRFQRAALARSMVEGVHAGRAPFGPSEPTGETIVIDFSSPNIAKPFHMGHLRSTVIGAALGRIHKHLGHGVHGINHLGDWGAQFGKMITAFERWGSEEELSRDPMEHMFELYVRYNEEAKVDPLLDQKSAEHFRNLESGEDNDERRMWQHLREESLKAFAGPYGRLRVEFDHVTGESFYEDKMESAIERVAQAGVLSLSEGAEIVDLSSEKMPPCILRKSDGTTIYATRDLAAIFYRLEEFKFDRAIYVVGAEQKLHFNQLRSVLERMGLGDISERVEHVSFGLILARDPQTDKWGKFATRGGNAVFLDEVLDEAVAKVRSIIEKKNPDLEDADEVAEQVGVSAIIFNDLKNARTKDVKFDWDAMLNFEGETGPYVQYAVARLSSILRKAGDDGRDLAAVDWDLLKDADQVLLSMLEFGPAVQRAADQNEPSVITNLMIDLAGRIHSYLKDHHVLRASAPVKKARLALVAASRELLKTGLGLIGVSAPDRM